MDKKIRSRFPALYCMVLADGVVEAAELEQLYRIGRETYGILADDITACVRDAGTSFEWPDSMEERIGLLYEMALIASADGDIDPTERQLLSRYVVRCGFDETYAGTIADFLLERAKQNLTKKQVVEEALKL